jgi:hypothetical protein
MYENGSNESESRHTGCCCFKLPSALRWLFYLAANLEVMPVFSPSPLYPYIIAPSFEESDQ